jgi:hypothetical protein
MNDCVVVAVFLRNSTHMGSKNHFDQAPIHMRAALCRETVEVWLPDAHYKVDP